MPDRDRATADWRCVPLLCAAFAAVGCGHAPDRPQVVASSPGRWQRQVVLPPIQRPQQVCAVLDGAAAAHADEITVWAGSRPVASTLTINSPQQAGSLAAQVLDFRSSDGKTEFDLRMPSRTYSEVDVLLARKNFAIQAAAFASGRQVGSAVLFDLTAQGLGSAGRIEVGERDDSLLHVRLDGVVARGDLLGADVPADRTAETVFTTVATTAPHNTDGQTVAEFTLPQGVPVERVLLAVPAGAGEFLRRVTVRATGDGQSTADVVTGTVQRVQREANGLLLRADNEAIAAELPDNLRGPMRVNVTLPSLPVTSVQLQMRERQLCFAAWPGVASWQVFYGAPSLSLVPVGGRTRSLVERAAAVRAQLGQEELAENFHPAENRETDQADRMLLAVSATLVLLALLATLALRVVRIPHIRR